MDRKTASELLRQEMNLHGLKDWSVRLNQNADSGSLDCAHTRISVLSFQHITSTFTRTPTSRTQSVHEVAHALVGPGHAHDDDMGCQGARDWMRQHATMHNLTLNPT